MQKNKQTQLIIFGIMTCYLAVWPLIFAFQCLLAMVLFGLDWPSIIDFFATITPVLVAATFASIIPHIVIMIGIRVWMNWKEGFLNMQKTRLRVISSLLLFFMTPLQWYISNQQAIKMGGGCHPHNQIDCTPIPLIVCVPFGVASLITGYLSELLMTKEKNNSQNQ